MFSGPLPSPSPAATACHGNYSLAGIPRESCDLPSPPSPRSRRHDAAHGLGVGVLEDVGFFAIRAAAEIVELGLAAQQPVLEIVLFLDQAVPVGNHALQARDSILHFFGGIDSTVTHVHTSSLESL